MHKAAIDLDQGHPDFQSLLTYIVALVALQGKLAATQ